MAPDLMNAGRTTADLPPTPRRQLVEMLVIVALYFFSARLGLLLAMPGGHVTPVWPPSGIALAAVLLLGRRIWPGIWLGSFLANFWDFAGTPAGVVTGAGLSAIFALGGTLTALLGARLMCRVFTPQEPLARVREVGLFMGLSGLLSCTLSATLGVCTLCTGGIAPWTDASQIWLTWWLGDTAGVFVFTPFLLVWAGPAARTGSRHWLEAAACFASLGLVTALVFLLNNPAFLGNQPLAFLVVPFLVWPAIRFGHHGATAGVALVTVLAVWGTVHGGGPFISAERNTALLLLEFFLCATVLTALCITAIVNERRKAETAQRLLLEELESRVRERTAELEISNRKLARENTQQVQAHQEIQKYLEETERMRTSLLSLLEDQKRSEAALRSSEAGLAAAQARAHLGSWELDLAHQQGTWSAEMYRVFGRDPALGAPPMGEVIAQIHPDDREVFQRDFNLAVAERRSVQLEFRVLLPDGGFRWIEGRGELSFDSAGQPVSLLGTSQDITERKEAEARLRESEERFHQLTENIDAVFWITDPSKRRVIYVSPAFEKIWGRPCQSLYDVPSTWHEAIYPDDRPRIIEAAKKMALGTYDVEYRIARPDGNIRWIRDKAFPIRDAAGEITRIAGVAEDMTERQLLEAQFRQAQKMEAIGTLAGGIAHDFNNILAAVKGYAQLAKAEAKDRPDLQDHLDEVLQGTLRAADLVGQIVTFSRQHESQYAAVSVQRIAKEALTLLRATIPTMIEFRLALETVAPAILADPTQIHQVVMNLCTNAWHAMKDRPGSLGVRVEPVTLDADFVQAHPELKAGGHVRLTVTDTGCGMDTATLSRIFDPFFTTKPPGEGSGLGLAVVHGIIQSHRGAIVVQSEPDVGTTFQLYFPEHTGASPLPPAPTLVPASPHGHQENILFVDDEEPLRRIGAIVLEKAGYTVQACASGTEALVVLQAQPDRFALVISDLAMPKMSGVELAAAIRGFRPDLPFILTSGNIDKTTKQRITELQIRQILSKPFSVESLRQAVHQVLTAQRT